MRINHKGPNKLWRRPIPDRAPTDAEIVIVRRKALDLIQRKRTMVLATRMGEDSWAAPVYYVHLTPAFYFFSARQAVHIRNAIDGPSSAAAIYADGDRLEQIEGLQMTGRITQVRKRREQLNVTQHFISKLPLAKSLLGDPIAANDLRKKKHLYRFTPDKIYYMDNRVKFGQRFEIELQPPSSKRRG